MGGGGGNGEARNGFHLYDVLGLHKECTSTELRNAYKKLAMRWHPDRYSASGNTKYVEEAKKKFQDIQEAYSVLSDSNKRLLYDVGAYDEDDDDNNNGMGEFLDEMMAMMNQTASTTNPTDCGGKNNDTFEELQDLFDEMFNGDMMGAAAAFPSSCFYNSSTSQTPAAAASSSSTCSNGKNGHIHQQQRSTTTTKNYPSTMKNGISTKRNSAHMTTTASMSYGFGQEDYCWTATPSSSSSNNMTAFQSFCVGVEDQVHRQQQADHHHHHRHPKRRVAGRQPGRTTTAS